MKTCTKCGQEQAKDNFAKSANRLDGLQCWCRSCMKAQKEKGKEDYAKKTKEWYTTHRAEQQEAAKQRYHANKSRRRETAKVWAAENPEKVRQSRVKRRHKARDYMRDYLRQRRAEDPSFKIRANLRTRLYVALRNNYRQGSAVRDLGCSIEELKGYLAAKFQHGMSWDNYGEWHIDHIVPLSAFNLQDPEQFKVAVHHTNLQPLWATENIRKGGLLFSKPY